MFDKGKYLLLPITLFLLGASVSVHAGLYDWGLKGVSDTTRVEKVLQFIDNPPFSNSEIGGYADPWSLGGDWIVYTVAGTNYHTLYKVRSDGTEPIQLTGNVTDDTNASFASDGRIYFDRQNHIDWKRQIWWIEGDGTKKNLSAVHGGGCEKYVRPSPDASLVAYSDCSSRELKVVRADGTFPVTVSGTQDINEPHHDWSPDSQWLAYKGNDGGNEWVYKVRPDGTSRTVLTKPPLPSFVTYSHLWPRWSPNGREIAYIHRVRFDSDYYYSLRVTSAEDGSTEQYLDSADNSVPGWQHISGPLSWSPDGNWVAYWKTFTSGATYRAIFIAPRDGLSAPIQLTTGYNDVNSFWSPDGSRILFLDFASSPSRDENGHNDLLMLKMLGSYGKFPWPLFLPAITSGNK